MGLGAEWGVRLPPDLPPNSVARGETGWDVASQRYPKTPRNPAAEGRAGMRREGCQRFSKPPPSATRPPLRGAFPSTQARKRLSIGPSCAGPLPYGVGGRRAQAQEMPLTTAPPVSRLSSSTVVGNTQRGCPAAA